LIGLRSNVRQQNHSRNRTSSIWLITENCIEVRNGVIPTGPTEDRWQSKGRP
jgi:hypothetical protein